MTTMIPRFDERLFTLADLDLCREILTTILKSYGNAWDEWFAHDLKVIKNGCRFYLKSKGRASMLVFVTRTSDDAHSVWAYVVTETGNPKNTATLHDVAGPDLYATIDALR